MTYRFEEADIDHYNPTVVDHWNSTGHDIDQASRRDYYNTSSVLRVLSKKVNSQLGREEEARYTRTVGKNFRGPKD